MLFSIRVYRVNGLIELPIEAETKEAALIQACETVARGIRIQPDGKGPLMFFRDARELLCVGVLAGDELPWRWDPERHAETVQMSAQPSPYPD